jgi:hypothetical protein
MSGDKNESGSTITGTGEFEHRDRYVIATVEIGEGLIRSISFGEDAPGGQKVCARLGDLLTGRSVSEALALTSQKVFEVCPEVCETRAHEVLLEAFHRAVEACLDQQ